MHRELLLKIARDLDSQEVEKLKFLCRDLVSQKELDTVKSALDLFQLLQQLELLGEDRPFLSELLRTICRLDLLRVLRTSQEEVKETPCRLTSYYCRVSPYRKMLYDLSEDTTEDTLKSMKFLLEMPCKFESASFFKVVEWMEKMDRLSEDNTEDLYQVLLHCKENQLAAKVKEYAEYVKGSFAETAKDLAMSFGPVTLHGSVMYGSLATSYSRPTTYGPHSWFSSASPCGPAASVDPLIFGGPATFQGSMMYGGSVTSYSLPTTYGPLACFSPATSAGLLTSGWPATFHRLMMYEGLATCMYGPLIWFSPAIPCGPAG